MSETKKEFLKRKKTEKHRQAEKQVREAYSRCIDVKDEDGETVKLLEIDGKHIEWRIRMEPEIEDIFSTIDVSKALNIPRERLRDWMVRDFIKSSLPSTSKGTIAIFTRDDVKLVMLFLKLLESGFKRDIASKHIEMLYNSKAIKAVSYIIIRHTIKDNEPEIEIASIVMGDKLSLQINSKEEIYCNKFPLIKNGEWEGIYIINMINLDRELVKALSRLD
ncbi:hypothetical protein [Desulfobacterium sp. N47]|uniref:HTH merR-type domain-containing protein n=1 Tax=uncultured Desulfobacterium sp. TaxID=201089 RepID=E1Y995_9BACT|nr:unknown protein [uncultured Desulfobacterium sp.]